MNTNSLNDKVKYMSRFYIAGDNYSMNVMKDLFKTFTKKNMNLLKSDYNLAGYIARYANK